MCEVGYIDPRSIYSERSQKKIRTWTPKEVLNRDER